MIEVFRSAVIASPIEEVWQAIRDFNGLAEWEPAVAASRIEAGRAAGSAGAIRNFTLQDGTRIREQLLELNDLEHRFSYRIVENDLGLIDYVANSQLRPVTLGNQTLFTRRASFRAPPGQESRLTRLVADDVMEASFAGLRSLMLQKDASPRPAARSGADIKGQAIRLSGSGGIEVMEMAETSASAPEASEVRIKQTAIGVNFIDIYCRKGLLDLVKPDGIPGFEAVGVVEDLGAQVTHLAKGDRVAYVCPQPGAYASVRTLDAACVLRAPNWLPDEKIAACLLKGITASYLASEVGQVKAGDTVVVYAAAGGTGSLLSQWAAALGARVIGIVSSQQKADFARRCGATEVVVTQEGDLVGKVKALTGEQGADIVFDAIGNDSFAQSLAILGQRGHLVSYGQASGAVGMRDIDALTGKSARLSRPNFFDYAGTQEQLKRHSDALFTMISDGKLSVNISARLALAEARQAHQILEGRTNCGSVVLTV